MRALLLAIALIALAACGARPEAAGPTPLPTPTAAERGKALFLSRGCASCHIHGAVENAGQSIGVGPALTVYRGDEEFLREWLRNPAAVRPNTEMPTLGLSEDEIDALTAFLIP
jgi:mono/diheme cytochrome c family protein